LLGPLDYGYRFSDSLEYTKNPAVSSISLGGPVMTDTLGLLLGRRGVTETLARKAPLIGTAGMVDTYFGEYFEENPYDELIKKAKEIDKEGNYLLGIKDRPKDRKYTRTYERSYTRNYATGGIVKGKDDVPYTKEDPADRVNKYTGQPYSDQMARLGLAEGGVPLFENRINNPDKYPYIKKGKKLVTHRMAQSDNIAYPMIQLQPDGTLEDYGDDFEAARKAAIKNKNFKTFKTEDEAIAYADGNYKTKKFNEYYNNERARLGFSKGGEVDKKTKNIIHINNLLKEKGYSKEARAGILGNIGVETAYTYDYTKQQDNGNGYGLMQFDFQKPFYNEYLKKNNLKDSAANQINFTHEAIHWNDDVMGMNTDDRRALQKSFKSNDINNATITFSEKYERPGIPHLEDRIKTANEIYKIID
jgi:hypothetical protein